MLLLSPSRQGIRGDGAPWLLLCGVPTAEGPCAGSERGPSLWSACRVGYKAEQWQVGLLSNIWLWRGVTAVLAAILIFIWYIQYVSSSKAKDLPVCPSPEVCPPGWLYFQRKCYYLSENEANWNSSQSHCSLHNASLLVLENQQELSFMMKITKQDPWIGLYKRNEEFFWVNGKALDKELSTLLTLPKPVPVHGESAALPLMGFLQETTGKMMTYGFLLLSGGKTLSIIFGSCVAGQTNRLKDG
ncbi:C-type lectin domain family 2 member L [Willisornis vidua]|uniref:C-type lectin domain family 2 member L n=1 Tax=Willisornis vidua TaxID=1566151 RepID=A0ABQ9DM48_9PASS|nr:C-type lectin domain family 2 member L [Willisornis vidua]